MNTLYLCVYIHMILQSIEILQQHRGMEAALRDRADRGAHILRSRLATLGIHGEELKHCQHT